MIISICIQDDNEEARRKRRRHTQLSMPRSIPTQTTNFRYTKIDASKMRPKGEGRHKPESKLALECNLESDDAQLLHFYAGCHAAFEL
jgi:hypothetical protein